MKNTVRVTATTLEIDEVRPQAVKLAPSSRYPWVEALSVALLVPAVYGGMDFWRDWFISLDRVICSVFVFFGLIVGLIRSDWVGERSLSRFVLSLSFFLTAASFILLSQYLGRPWLSCIACGVVLAGWCSYRILGESVYHSASLGLIFAIPSFIDVLAAQGTFDWLETQSVSFASGLADAVELSHAREGSKLMFGLGTADQFACLGKWDSVVSFFGIAVFCVLAFRRNLICGALTISLSGIVWIAVQGTAWVTLAWLANKNGVWYEWTPELEIGLFLIAMVLVVSVDQFFSALFEPIPFEFINADFPLFAYLWNWMCGLPKLTLSIPVRDDEFTELREIAQWEAEA